MLLRVVVQPVPQFEEWLANQGKPAADDPAVRAGRDVFLSNSCVNCHTVRGTPAAGKFGPDLTHLASRQTLASGMVTNGDRQFTREQLLRWVTDPQKVKPGCLMAAFGLSRRENEQLTDYLLSLK
jgi:cytochrome c oxidase subunit 2